MPALRLGPPDPGDHPLPDQVPLELRDRAQNVEHQPPGWGGGIDRLVRDDEVNPERLELSREAHEVPRRPSQAIELCGQHDVQSPGARGGQERVEARPARPTSADAVVGVLGSGPPARLGKRSEHGQLVLRNLVGGGPAGVEARSQRPASGRDAILGTAAGRDAQGLGDRAHA